MSYGFGNSFSSFTFGKLRQYVGRVPIFILGKCIDKMEINYIRHKPITNSETLRESKRVIEKLRALEPYFD